MSTPHHDDTHETATPDQHAGHGSHGHQSGGHERHHGGHGHHGRHGSHGSHGRHGPPTFVLVLGGLALLKAAAHRHHGRRHGGSSRWDREHVRARLDAWHREAHAAAADQ